MDGIGEKIEKQDEVVGQGVGEQEVVKGDSSTGGRKQAILMGVMIAVLFTGLAVVVIWASFQEGKSSEQAPVGQEDKLNEQAPAGQEGRLNEQAPANQVGESRQAHGLRRLAGAGAGADGQTSIIYFADTGEVQVDAPADKELTSVMIESEAGIFYPTEAENIEGGLDKVTDQSIFKATFTESFGSISFGRVAKTGLAESFIYEDLQVAGSLAGGGWLGEVDLIYVPEGGEGPAEVARKIEVSRDEANFLAGEKVEAVMRRILADNGGRRVEWNNYTRDDIVKAFKTNSLPDPNDWAMCAVQFNSDAPDEWVEYQDKNYGMVWQIPYNVKWGNEAISVPLIDPNFGRQDNLVFGPIIAGFEGGCGWERNLRIQYKPSQSADELKQELEDKWGGLAVPVVKTVGRREVVTYTSAGLCEGYHAEIVGEDYNYLLSAACSGLDGEAELLEEIVRRAIF